MCLIITAGTYGLLHRWACGIGTLTGPKALSGLASGECGFLLHHLYLPLPHSVVLLASGNGLIDV